MRWFLDSYAGRGMAAVLFAVAFLAWPLSLVWTAAAACLVYAARQFHTSFQLIEAGDTADVATMPAARTPNATERDCDMGAVMASLAASPASPAIRNL